jgi:large subunit ribosomal protein L22
MQVKVTAKYIRIAPRKTRLVVDQVRGLSVEKAEQTLQFMNKAAAEPVLKAIRSAVANAEHNHQLDKANLYVAQIFANEGFKMKRFMPRAFGRASQVMKRTSHITVVLDEKEKKVTPAAPAKSATASKTEVKSEKKTAVAEKETAVTDTANQTTKNSK